MVLELHEALKVELGEAIADMWFVPIGGPAKSGALIAYLYRSLNRVSADRFLTYEQARDRLDQNGHIVLLDDLLASGHQAVKEWGRISGGKDGTLGNATAYLATLVACEAGQIYVTERTSLKSISVMALNRSDEPLSAQSRLFPNLAEREQVRNLLIKYGTRLAPNGPLGYSGSGLLLAFEHSTPDNTLPIFWASAERWKPLLSKASPARGASSY
jgi:hypothetical protein